MGSSRLAFLFALLFVGACDMLAGNRPSHEPLPIATIPPPPPPSAAPPPPPSKPRAKPNETRRQVALVPPKPPVPVTPPPQIVGLSDAGLLETLGRPEDQRDVPPAKIWRYRSGDCELDIFLYLDVARNRFHALQYDARPPNNAPAARDQCLVRLREDAAQR
jgi:hypothetical protein